MEGHPAGALRNVRCALRLQLEDTSLNDDESVVLPASGNVNAHDRAVRAVGVYPDDRERPALSWVEIVEAFERSSELRPHTTREPNGPPDAESRKFAQWFDLLQTSHVSSSLCRWGSSVYRESEARLRMIVIRPYPMIR